MLCSSCGYKLNYNKKLSILYLVLGKDKRYVRCTQCQKTHCIRLVYHIVKDNVDDELMKRNRFKTDWRKLL